MGSPLYTCLISHLARDVWRAYIHASVTLSVTLSPFYISGCSITFPNGNCNFRGTKVWVFLICFLPSLSLLADRAAAFYHDPKWAHPLWQQSCWFSSQSYHSQISSDRTGRDGRSPGQEGHRLLFYFFLSSGHFSMCCLPSVSLQGPKMVACWQFCPFLYLVLVERICWPFHMSKLGAWLLWPNVFFMAHMLPLANSSGLQIFHWLFYALWVSHYSLFQLPPLFRPLGKTLGPWPSLGLRLWLLPLPLSQGSHLALLPSALQIFLQHPSAK